MVPIHFLWHHVIYSGTNDKSHGTMINTTAHNFFLMGHHGVTIGVHFGVLLVQFWWWHGVH